MEQEQRLVLKMLEEGKITAAEAESLLNALQQGEPEEKGGQEDDFWARLEKQGEEFAQKVESATERFSRSLESKTEALVTDKLAKLPKIFAKLPFIELLETHEFTETFTGGLQEGLEQIPITLSTFNGSINVEGWPQEGYQLTVKQRLRGKDRDLLRGRLYQIGWEDGAIRDSLDVKIPPLEDAVVSLELKVPQERNFLAHLDTHNGSLHVSNFKGSVLELETTNGSSQLRQVQAESIQGQINNGSCRMDGVEAKSVLYRVGNGSYRLRLAAADFSCITTNGSINLETLPFQGDSNYQLRTTNGSVTVKIPRVAGLGVAVDLKASVGRISTNVGPLEFSRQERGGGSSVAVGRSAGFADQAAKISITASSSSGSISVGGIDA